MLTIFENSSRQGRSSRRRFLTAGATGLTGLSLAQLLHADDVATRQGRSSREKSIIHVHLDGGPPHMDMIDLKPDAPSEIRGEFREMRTRLPGFRVCELLPKLASTADKYVFIRSVVGAASAHDAFQCQSGFAKKDLAAIGGRPTMGAVLSKLWGQPSDAAPPFVDLMQGRPLVRNSARPGFLGPAYGPFRPDVSKKFARPLEPGMKKELAALGPGHTTSLSLTSELDGKRVRGRLRLLDGFDRFRSEFDKSGQMEAHDRFTQQAFSILTSGRFAQALDLDSEDPRVVAKYAVANPPNTSRFVTADEPHATQKFLLARRLIEAGVRCVSLSISDFDTHSANFPRMRYILPILDHGLHALLSDLEERGMLDDVLIVIWGEFGRTPRINNSNGGRDHWPGVGMAMLAGGGLKVGQVIGKTDRTASTATERPIHVQDVLATAYRALGVDLAQATLTDPQGRPHYLLEKTAGINGVL